MLGLTILSLTKRIIGSKKDWRPEGAEILDPYALATLRKIKTIKEAFKNKNATFLVIF